MMNIDLKNYAPYVGECKHNATSGNMFYGDFCHDCGARNFHSANPEYPDIWYLLQEDSFERDSMSTGV